MWWHYGGVVLGCTRVYWNVYPNRLFYSLKAINNLCYCTIVHLKGSRFLWYSSIVHFILCDISVRISSLSLYCIFILYSFVYMVGCLLFPYFVSYFIDHFLHIDYGYKIIAPFSCITFI